MSEPVFICYARVDREFVVELATGLRARGVPVWLDLWDIPPGADWDETIDAALEAATHILIVLSPDSVGSKEVRGELRTALNENKKIVPVLYRPCDIPRQLQIIEYADFTNPDLDRERRLDQVTRALGLGQPASVQPERDLPPAAKTSVRRRRALWVTLCAVALAVGAAVLWSLWPAASRPPERIVLWKVGSPSTNETPAATVPDDLRAVARQAGLTIEMEVFAAQGFAQRLADAMKRNAAPDILSFDNAAILEGGQTPSGRLTGIEQNDAVRQALVPVSESLESLEPPGGSWQFLVATSPNYARARILSLKGFRCPDDPRSAAPNGALLRDVGSAAVTAALGSAYGVDGKDVSAWLLQQAPDTGSTGGRAPAEKPKIADVRVCSVWGNTRLAFVNTALLYEAERAIGQRSALIVLKKPGASWEVETITADILAVQRLAAELPVLSEAAPTAQLQIPVLLTPLDHAALPRFPPPELAWRTAEPQPVGYLIESQLEWERSKWADSVFDAVNARGTSGLVRKPAPFGTGAQPHRWRVWAIGQSGQVQISAWRTINFTN